MTTRASQTSTQQQQVIEAAIARHGGNLVKAADAEGVPLPKVIAVWNRMEMINETEDVDTPPGRPRGEVLPCGTDAAYQRHKVKHEPVDGACLKAHNAANRERDERREREAGKLATVTVIHQAPQEEPAQPLVGYTTVEAKVLAGVSYREIDFWTRTGRLRPVGDPHSSSWQRRRYSESEVDVARTGKRLLDAGFTVDAALKLARQLVESGVPVRLAHGLVVIDPAGVDG